MDQTFRSLYIDDSELDRFYVQAIIKHNKLPIVPTFMENGIEALNYLKECAVENLPEIMFVDIHMPYLNGFEFVTSFNETFPEKIDKIPIFMLSSSFMGVDIEKIDEFSNILGLIEKPFSKELFERMALPCLKQAIVK